MKKLYILSLFAICYLLLAIAPAGAITPTPTKKVEEKPTNTEIINDLKERIASRVAQLRLVEKKGVIGTVTDISDTQITISDIQNNIRFIDVDEITKFSSPSAKGSFGISDISKGTKLGILGLYNKQSRRILARFVDVISLSKFISGAVTTVDKENFSIALATENSSEVDVDIETISKTQSYTKDDGLVKSGFSKIKEGQHIVIVGFTDIKDKNLPAGRQGIIASRIIIFPELPSNPRIKLADLNTEESVTPSTGSGKKLTPIKQ